MRHVNCLIPAFILLVSAAGCNCCYQPGYYSPNGLVYQQTLPVSGLHPLQKPAWLSQQSRKHDPKTCPLCNSHAAAAPQMLPGGQPGTLPLPAHPNGTFQNSNPVDQAYGPEGFPVLQPAEDQPVHLNGIVPTSYEESGSAQRSCGCGNTGCSGNCHGQCGHSSRTPGGQCGADRNRGRGCCGAHRPRTNGSSHCSCGGAHQTMNHGCGCSGTVSHSSPCISCDVVEGFPMGSTVIDSGCATCGTNIDGLTVGSVIPGTMLDGQIISGGILPGEVIGGDVLFDSSAIDGNAASGAAGTCSHCGKSHTNLKPVPGPGITPHPQSTPPSTEALPGQVNQGTLKPQAPPAGEPQIKATAEPAVQQPSLEAGNPPAPATTNEPEPMPGVLLDTPAGLPASSPEFHPPAGAARARTTPSSWRTSRPVDNPGIFQHSDFQAPVHPSKRIEPTTLMIPTIPDNEKTRQVHWLPEQQ